MERIIKTTLSILLVGIIGATICFVGSIYLIGKVHQPMYQPVKFAKDHVANGDIIFHISQSEQSKAIQLATNSKYSHCGIIYWDHGQCYVLEAANVVKATPLKDFIERGEDKHHVVKRLKNSKDVLNSIEVLEKMTDVYSKYAGKPYDLYFEWSGERIYCSELIWKLFKASVNIEIGELQPLREFDLANKMVKVKLEERYGAKIPLDELVISPASIFNSDKLVTIIDN